MLAGFPGGIKGGIARGIRGDFPGGFLGDILEGKETRGTPRRNFGEFKLKSSEKCWKRHWQGHQKFIKLPGIQLTYSAWTEVIVFTVLQINIFLLATYNNRQKLFKLKLLFQMPNSRLWWIWSFDWKVPIPPKVNGPPSINSIHFMSNDFFFSYLFTAPQVVRSPVETVCELSTPVEHQSED